MTRIPGKLCIQIVSFCIALVGCRGQPVPTVGVTTAEQTATTILSTPSIAPVIPAEQTTAAILATPAITPTMTLQPTQAENIQILDLDFINPENGWLLASTYYSDNSSGIIIRQTVDGGTSWTAVPAPKVKPASWMDFTRSNSNIVSQILFLDGQTGWIYRPGLFYTQDAGKDWRSIDLDGAIVALESAGPNKPVWAIVQNCPHMPECSEQLYQTTPDKPGLWTLVSAIAMQQPMLAFIRPNGETGYILSNVASDNFQVDLIATHDAGSTWTTSATLCSSEQPLLAAPDVSHLYLVCSGLPSAGQQGKQFYTSTDGGTSWSLIQNSNQEKTIPIFGYADALEFLTPKVGVVGLGRSSLIYTQDGGKSWIGTDIPNIMDASGWVLARASEQDIFAALNATIYNSLDGGVSWTSTEIY